MNDLLKKTAYLMLFLLLIVLSGCGTQTPTVVDPQADGAILFGSNRSGKEMYYLSGTGGSEQEVTPLVFEDLPANAQYDRPVWSPILNKWVLSVITGSDAEIYSADWNGANLTNLTQEPGRYDSSPVVSPDGKWIAFVAIGSDLDIFIIKPDGSEETNLTFSLGGREMNPVWGNDSNRLFFSSNWEGTPNIYQMSRSGKNVKNLTRGKGLDESFSLSPDQSRLAFSSDRDGNMDIFILDLKSEEITNITKSIARDAEPIWSPDGNYIAYRTIDPEDRDLFLYTVSDGSVKELTNTPEIVEEGVSWWPNSQQLIYTVRDDEQMDIYRIDLNGNTQKVTDHPAIDYAGIWLKKP